MTNERLKQIEEYNAQIQNTIKRWQLENKVSESYDIIDELIVEIKKLRLVIEDLTR